MLLQLQPQLHIKTAHSSEVKITSDGETCKIISNALPNHDLNKDNGFFHGFAEQKQSYTVPANPTAIEEPAPLTPSIDNAIFLNGVKLDLVAADGFPIYGSFINDNGTIRAATTSYQLKSGTCPEGDNGPGGTYDGTYIDDWE